MAENTPKVIESAGKLPNGEYVVISAYPQNSAEYSYDTMRMFVGKDPTHLREVPITNVGRQGGYNTQYLTPEGTLDIPGVLSNNHYTIWASANPNIPPMILKALEDRELPKQILNDPRITGTSAQSRASGSVAPSAGQASTMGQYAIPPGDALRLVTDLTIGGNFQPYIVNAGGTIVGPHLSTPQDVINNSRDWLAILKSTSNSDSKDAAALLNTMISKMEAVRSGVPNAAEDFVKLVQAHQNDSALSNREKVVLDLNSQILPEPTILQKSQMAELSGILGKSVKNIHVTNGEAIKVTLTGASSVENANNVIDEVLVPWRNKYGLTKDDFGFRNGEGDNFSGANDIVLVVSPQALGVLKEHRQELQQILQSELPKLSLNDGRNTLAYANATFADHDSPLVVPKLTAGQTVGVRTT